MSKVLVTESNLQNIADAIRSKNQGSDNYRPGDMAAAILAIPTGGGSTLVSKTITQNGEYDPEDDNADGYSDVTVNVPNSYSAEDEGKVVSSGALVAQTSLSVTENGTYDTTENDEVAVNVSGGGEIMNLAKLNYTLESSCHVKSGRVTGFSSSSSLWQPKDASNNQLAIDWSLPFKIHAKFILTNTYNGSQCLYGANGTNTYFVLPTCEVHLSEIWFGFTTNGSSWTDSIMITDIPFVAGGEYEVTAEYDGTNISVSVSDGTNTWSRDIVASGTLYSGTNYRIAFGGIARNSSLIARYVEFDPYDTYIESNGAIIWGGYGAESNTLISKTITQNGEYDALDDGVIGYSDVTVDVSSGGGGQSLLDVLSGKRFCVVRRSNQYYGGFGDVGTWPSSGTTTSGENLAPNTDYAVYTVNEIKKIILNGGVLAHCEYLGYVDSTIINDFGLVELARVTTTAQTDITLADDLSNYDAVFLQGVYQSGGDTSRFDSTLIYAPVALNTEYKTGMKDRWAPGDTGVTFTSNTTAVLSDQKLVIIYGMRKQAGGNT